MLFDYLIFKEELCESINPEKREIIKKWKLISNAQSIEEEPFYEYLNIFKVEDIPFKIPEDLIDDFDWKLLFQLVAGSFSSDYALSFALPDKLPDNVIESELPELHITVKSDSKSITKTVNELWSFQILRLFEIYFEEQINLHILKSDNEIEKFAIDNERKLRIKKFNIWKKEYLFKTYLQRQKILRNEILVNVNGKYKEN